MATQTVLARAQYYQQVSSLYTNNGWDRIRRHYAYIRTPDLATQNGMTTALSCISFNAFIGAKVGKKIGTEVERFVYHDLKSGEVGGLIGSGMGFVAGGAFGGYVYMTLTERHPSFERWRKDCIEETIKLATTFSYSDDELLQHLTCPVSLCVMDVPVHTPSGIFYDMTFLMNCPREPNGDIKDPNRNPSFSEKQAIPDFERSFVIHKKLQALLRADLSEASTNQEVSSVIQHQLAEIDKATENRYENGREEIEARRRAKTITHDKYKTEMEEFEKVFGSDWEKDLNWDIDWIEILNQRWVYFHPDAKIVGYN
jgi:hypothetical protein